VNGVAACHRAADEVTHNIAAAGIGHIASLIGQIGYNWAGDATGRKGQGRFL